MTGPQPFAAELLERSASGYASAAASQLVEEHPEITELFKPDPRGVWRNHLNQRLLELAAAVATGEPELFVQRVQWSRKAFIARGMNDEILASSLRVLRDSLSDQLPEMARSGVISILDAAMAAIDEPAVEDDSGLDATQVSGKLALQYLQSVLEGNIVPGMEVVLDAVERDEVDAATAIVDVLLPAQREVGRLWHLDQVTVAEEHLVTSTTQRLMAVIVSRAERLPDRGKTAVAASVSGNIHDVGIRAISYLLELAGWRTIFLGADVPRGDLPATVQFFNADVVLLSSSLSVQLRTLKESINAIREKCEHPVKILVGGQAFSDAEEVWSTLGADGYAPDADQALILAESVTRDGDTH